MGLSNDERGWIMTSLSGVACAVGASVICVDVLVRQFPGKKNFRIQDSDTFMSVSLSLSFGVMLFSSLYNMLPSAKRSLIKGGHSSSEAGWILIACFTGGVIGIQILSRVIHSFLPSHVVDCEHDHDSDSIVETRDPHRDGHQHQHSPPKTRPRRRSSLRDRIGRSSSHLTWPARQPFRAEQVPQMTETIQPNRNYHHALSEDQRLRLARTASISQRMTRTISHFTHGKGLDCDCSGKCHGYSDPCGSECFKRVIDRGGFKVAAYNAGLRPELLKSNTAQTIPTVNEINEATPLLNANTQQASQYGDTLATPDAHEQEDLDTSLQKYGPTDAEAISAPKQHHHHVPSNAFLSIGLQTSVAIALHKLPEGFITYATNHANPQLGISVFLALFIHNITEGFALALPLYLALQSRFKAMVISFVLGGLSQPLGAAVAAIWFRLAGTGHWAPNESVYGGMFAATAGIMTSVALQLFSESLDLTHSKDLCITGAFCGMLILGISSALTG